MSAKRLVLLLREQAIDRTSKHKLLILKSYPTNFLKPSINDVVSKREEGDTPKSILKTKTSSTKRDKKGREGVINYQSSFMECPLGHSQMHFIDCYFGMFITFPAT